MSSCAAFKTFQNSRITDVQSRPLWFLVVVLSFPGIIFSFFSLRFCNKSTKKNPLLLFFVRFRCDGVYDTPVLGHVIVWKDQVLLKWIDLLLRNERRTAESTPKGGEKRRHQRDGGVGDGGKGLFQAEARSGRKRDGSNDQTYGWAQRLGLAVHEAFCSARIAELFDIIADYPDSAVAVGELKASGSMPGPARRCSGSSCCARVVSVTCARVCLGQPLGSKMWCSSVILSCHPVV